MSGPDGLDTLAVPARSAARRTPAWTGSPVGGTGLAGTARGRPRTWSARPSTPSRTQSSPDEQPDLLERAVTLYSELRDLDRLQDVRRLMRGREDEAGPDVRQAMEAAAEAERNRPAPRPGPNAGRSATGCAAAFLAFLDRHPILLMAVATLPAYDLAD